jgi:hypothetical protein
MGELELFLLTGVLIANFNTVDLVKFLEKKSKTSHLDCSSHKKVTSCKTIRKKKVKKSEKPRFYGKKKLIF